MSKPSDKYIPVTFSVWKIGGWDIKCRKLFLKDFNWRVCGFCFIPLLHTILLDVKKIIIMIELFLLWFFKLHVHFFNFKIFYYAELSEILTVDGVYKLLFAINGELPGPPIVVYEGQTVSSRNFTKSSIYISKSNFILFFFFFRNSIFSFSTSIVFFLVFFGLNIHIGGWVGGVKGAASNTLWLNWI